MPLSKLFMSNNKVSLTNANLVAMFAHKLIIKNTFFASLQSTGLLDSAVAFENFRTSCLIPGKVAPTDRFATKLAFLTLSKAKFFYFMSYVRLSKFTTIKHRIVDKRWAPPRLVEFDFSFDNPLQLMSSLEKSKAKLNLYMPLSAFKSKMFAGFGRKFLFNHFKFYEKFLEIKLYRAQHKSAAFTFYRNFSFTGFNILHFKLFQSFSAIFLNSDKVRLLFIDVLLGLLTTREEVNNPKLSPTVRNLSTFITCFLHPTSKIYFREFATKLYYDYVKHVPLEVAKERNPGVKYRSRDRDQAKHYAWNYPFVYPEFLSTRETRIKQDKYISTQKRLVKFRIWKMSNRSTTFFWVSGKMRERTSPNILNFNSLYYNTILPNLTKKNLMRINARLCFDQTSSNYNFK